MICYMVKKYLCSRNWKFLTSMNLSKKKQIIRRNISFTSINLLYKSSQKTFICFLPHVSPEINILDPHSFFLDEDTKDFLIHFSFSPFYLKYNIIADKSYFSDTCTCDTTSPLFFFSILMHLRFLWKWYFFYIIF